MLDVPALIKDWGAGSLLAFCIVLILVGRLSPRSTLDDVIRERDNWRDIALQSVGQVEQLLEIARTTQSLVLALQPNSVTMSIARNANGVPVEVESRE